MGHLLSGSVVGLMAMSSKRTYATCLASQLCCSQSPCPPGRPLLTCASAEDTQTLKGKSGSDFVGSLGPGVHKVWFEPSKHLWRVWGFILNTILPLLPSCWGLSFALGQGVSFLVGSNILLSMVVQQQVAILEFSQEKMSTCPSTKIVVSDPITTWQIDGKTMETVIDFIFLGSKITADGDCSHEIKRHLLLGRKAMTNLDRILKQRHYFADKGLSSKSYGFSSSHIWMWDLDYKESWALKNYSTSAFPVDSIAQCQERPLPTISPIRKVRKCKGPWLDAPYEAHFSLAPSSILGHELHGQGTVSDW